MRSYYDWIYLSPHLDDAALSCGGQIFLATASGQSVLIVSIMAGDPPQEALSGYAESLHTRWRLAADAATQRRAEDLAACRILGADALHWSMPDCIYRHDPQSGAPLYLSDADIFGEVHGAEHDLVDALAEQMRVLPAHAHLVAPLTVGHHVDHQLARAAAERAFGATSLLDSELVYYEDYPYARDELALHRALGDDHARWRVEIIPLSPAALQARINAIVAFRSQLSTFFTNLNDLTVQVTSFITSRGGERLWRQVPTRYP
jgi:LmbE family N-acetylglucosaminyl deacetylase